MDYTESPEGQAALERAERDDLERRRDRACEGGETRTIHGITDFEECVDCGTAVRWDLVDHPFVGFSPKNCIRNGQ